jgi:hypothetical protein
LEAYTTVEELVVLLIGHGVGPVGVMLPNVVARARLKVYRLGVKITIHDVDWSPEDSPEKDGMVGLKGGGGKEWFLK